MNDKKIKEAMKQYIETQADNISSESEEILSACVSIY